MNEIVGYPVFIRGNCDGMSQAVLSCLLCVVLGIYGEEWEVIPVFEVFTGRKDGSSLRAHMCYDGSEKEGED